MLDTCFESSKMLACIVCFMFCHTLICFGLYHQSLLNFAYGSFSFVAMFRMTLFPKAFWPASWAGWAGLTGPSGPTGWPGRPCSSWLGWPDQRARLAGRPDRLVGWGRAIQAFLPEGTGWPHWPETLDWHSLAGQTGLASLPSQDTSKQIKKAKAFKH